MDKKVLKEIFDWVVCIVVAVVIALSIRAYLFELVEVHQTSMWPTISDGDKVGMNKLVYKNKTPERGDVIVINISGEKNYIKRVIALEGETIEIKDSKVYIDGVLLEEDYISDDLVYDDFGPFTVDEGCIFVMGDNRPVSVDSRDSRIGEINLYQVMGKAIFILYPFKKL